MASVVPDECRDDAASASGRTLLHDGPYIDPSSARLRQIRESFLSTGTIDFREVEQAGIDQRLVDSWRRCLRYGLDPRTTRPAPGGEADVDSLLVRIVNGVVMQREAALEQSMCGLSLTDDKGVVLRQWLRDRALRRWLEQQNIVPSFSVDETVLGTTSGICLLNEQPTMVRGLEHFCDDYAELASAGVPLVHPVTHRIVGSLNLGIRIRDASPVLLSWVMDIVRDVQRALVDAATERERALLDAYLMEMRDARHPLVVLNDRTVITNAAAARMLTSVDQALLWEHACRTIYNDHQDECQLVLTDGTTVSVQCREVTDASASAGAVVRIRPVIERKSRKGGKVTAAPAAALPGLVGEGPRWRRLCRQATEAAKVRSPVLLVGERGTGKVAVAQAMSNHNAVVLDAVDINAQGVRAWVNELKRLLNAPDEAAVIIRRCDELEDSTATTVGNLIHSHRDGPVRIFATATQVSEHRQVNTLQAEFPLLLEVPALRERLEDLPALLGALTRTASERLGRAPSHVRWMPDAVQALSRVEWRGNVASLQTVVVRVLQKTSNNYISSADLPDDITGNAARRKLGGLEQLEATAIITALREAGGNKSRTAESLGIARSTLYRKTRALGIDLSASTF